MSTPTTTRPTADAADASAGGNTSAPLAAGAEGHDAAVYGVTAGAGFLALAALMVGGTAMSLTALNSMSGWS